MPRMKHRRRKREEEGARARTAPPPPKIGKIFFGNYHVKFGNFVNFPDKYHKYLDILIIFSANIT